MEAMKMPRVGLKASQPQNMRLSRFAQVVLDAVADELGLNRRGAVETVTRFIHRLHEESGQGYAEILIKDTTPEA